MNSPVLERPGHSGPNEARPATEGDYPQAGVLQAPLTGRALESCIEQVREYSQPAAGCLASVVIVAYNTNLELLHCLDSLRAQSESCFETVVVDNGKNDVVYGRLGQYPIKYIRLRANYKPSLARNVGITQSRGDVVCFLDDDAIAGPEFVAQHIACLESGALGVRGRILPKTGSLYNSLAHHYDLGSEPVVSYVDMENNASFPRRVLIDVGGFNPQVFAGEGAELSYRIVQRFGAHDRLLYHPGAVVYHDFSTSLKKLLKKTLRGAKMYVLLERQYPDFWDFVESYHPLPWGGVPRPRNLPDRVRLAALRRMLPRLTGVARAWYGWTLRSQRTK